MPGAVLDGMQNNDPVIAPVAILSKTKDMMLVANAKRGSGGAFEALIKRHQQGILRVAQRMLGNREDAEDVVWQSFQKAFVYLHTFEQRSSFSTWLTRIAINEAIMSMRSTRRMNCFLSDSLNPGGESGLELQVADSKPNPESSYSEQEKSQILSSAIDQLEPRLRAAIQLCHLDERSLQESAEIIGVTVTALKSRLLRGRRKLRQSLRPFLTSTWTSGGPSSCGGAHTNPKASAAWRCERKSKGGCQGDDSLKHRAGGLGFAVPSRSWRREWIGPSPLNRVRKTSRSALAEAKRKE
jgi:RNA polymerase sigma-70 factor (ECF subfamily)